MAEKRDYEDSHSGNWNYAKGYVIEKIHRWLVLIDTYQTLSIFGSSDIYGDTFMKDNNLRNTARLNSLRRLIQAILSLIRNTHFAIKNEDKESFERYSKRLYLIEKNLPKLRVEKKRGNRVVELSINEYLFERIMGELTEMISDIHFKLNKANLIFTNVEDVNVDELKREIEGRFINKT